MFHDHDIRTVLTYCQQDEPNEAAPIIEAMPIYHPKPDPIEFSKRLNQAMDDIKQPARGRGVKLAVIHGVKPPTAHAWLSGKHMPEPDKARKMALDYGVEFDWLYFFKGPKRKDDTIAPIPAYSIRAWENEDDINNDSEVMIPVFEIELSQGNGTVIPEYVETKQHLPFQRDWLRRKRAKPSDCKIFPVRGESMLPTLNDGDLVLVNTAETRIVEGKIYALIIGGEAKLKRLKRRADGTLVVISDNAAQFPPEEVSPEHQEHVTIIGRALNRSGDL